MPLTRSARALKTSPSSTSCTSLPSVSARKKITKRTSSNNISRYSVTSTLLGEGVRSKVFLGKTKNGKKLAIKEISKNVPVAYREEIEGELQVLQAIRNKHQNLISLLCVKDKPKSLELVFEHHPSTLLDMCLRYEDGLPETDAKKYFRQLVDAVNFLHNFTLDEKAPLRGEICTNGNFLPRRVDGISHRDIKLENILVSEDESTIFLIDFGFSCFLQPGEKLAKQCGSINYIAPEIINKLLYDGRKSDMWSLGCVLYCMVVGYLPFEAQDKETLFSQIVMGKVSPIPSRLSPLVKDLLSSLLHLDPQKRLTIQEVASHPWLRDSPQ